METRFYDLSPSSYPFVVEFIADDTGRTVHTITVDGPGMLRVPPLAGEYGPIRCRVTWPDGQVIEHPSLGGRDGARASRT